MKLREEFRGVHGYITARRKDFLLPRFSARSSNKTDKPARAQRNAQAVACNTGTNNNNVAVVFHVIAPDIQNTTP